MLSQIHRSLAPVVVAANGLAGLAGLVLALRRLNPRWYRPLATVALAVALAQVLIGVALLGTAEPPGSFHTFYGMVIAFTLVFAYLYRAQLERRPALAYSMLALFVMGLGIRGWINIGVDL